MTEAAPSKKILLIEDSKNISGVLVDVLKAEGYTVMHAPDGVTGVAMTRREKPDLVLLDLLLPKLSGYDVCNTIKRDNNTRHIPVLVISTMDKPESVARAKAAGAANFMRKPYNLDDLLAEIKRLLGR
ncbi:MAG: response regulator [Elusimicrobiales bacterium]|nr:response regulator [Elusimicrobiales bacterium]